MDRIRASSFVEARTGQRIGDPFGKSDDPDDQAHGFSGRALPPSAKLWSKAGWTSQVRHDAAYIELADGAKFVLVIFTADHANEREIIPALGRVILGGIAATKETAR